MDIRTVTTGLVALVVAIMIVALVAVPIVEDATQGTSFSGTNSGADARYSDLTGKAVTWTWNGTGSVTVDGNTAVSPNAIPAVISDKIIVRTSSTGMYWYDLTSSTYATVHGTTDTATLTVTAAGAYTFTIDDVTKTGTVTKLLVSTQDGKIGHFTGQIHSTFGSAVYIGNFTAANGPVRFASFVDGVQGADLFAPWVLSEGSIVSAGTVSYNVTYSTQGEGQQIGTYSASSVTYDGGSYSGMSWYAPLDYKSTAVANEGGINGTLLAIIPLLLFVVAVMMAVRLIRDA